MSQKMFEAGLHEPQHTMWCRSFAKPYLSGITKATIGMGLGSFVNRRNKEHRKNVEFVCKGSKTANPTVWIKAMCTIVAESELYASYGTSFKLPGAAKSVLNDDSEDESE